MPDSAQGAQQNSSMAVNLSYFRTYPGLCKVIELLFGIVCLVCGYGLYFSFVSILAFVVTAIFSLLYLFSLREVLRLPVNWVVLELAITGIIAILYIAGCITLLASGPGSLGIVSGIFGIILTITYAIGTYLLYYEM